MPSIASYCFKPKHGPDIAKKIIQHFCNKFLSYDHEGFYLYWREYQSEMKFRKIPQGWVEFYVDTDNGNMEAWSETCFYEEELDGQDMTEHFFAMLGDDFWYEDDDGNTVYTMYERELFEIVAALSQKDSRAIAWGGDRTAYVSYVDSKGDRGVKQVDMLSHVMTTPFDDEKKEDRQFTLDLG